MIYHGRIRKKSPQPIQDMQQKSGETASCGLSSWWNSKTPTNSDRWQRELGQLEILGRIRLVRKKTKRKPKAIQHKGSISSIKGCEIHHVRSGWHFDGMTLLKDIFSCPYHQKKRSSGHLITSSNKTIISLMGVGLLLFSNHTGPGNSVRPFCNA